MPKSNQRKKRLIHRGIQLTMVRRLLIQWVVFVAATAVVTLALQYMLDPFKDPQVLSAQLKVMLGSMFIVSLCLAPVFIRDSIKLSHRVVGPVLRLQSAFRDADPKQSNERIRIRRSDFLKEVIADYNEMLDRFEKQIEQQHASTQETDSVA